MDAARILEAAYAHHADIFGYGIKGPQKVILYDSFIDFEQTNVIPGHRLTGRRRRDGRAHASCGSPAHGHVQRKRARAGA